MSIVNHQLHMQKYKPSILLEKNTFSAINTFEDFLVEIKIDEYAWTRLSQPLISEPQTLLWMSEYCTDGFPKRYTGRHDISLFLDILRINGHSMRSINIFAPSCRYNLYLLYNALLSIEKTSSSLAEFNFSAYLICNTMHIAICNELLLLSTYGYLDAVDMCLHAPMRKRLVATPSDIYFDMK